MIQTVCYDDELAVVTYECAVCDLCMYRVRESFIHRFRDSLVTYEYGVYGSFVY